MFSSILDACEYHANDKQQYVWFGRVCAGPLFDLSFSQIQLEYATPLSRILRGKKLANRTRIIVRWVLNAQIS